METGDTVKRLKKLTKSFIISLTANSLIPFCVTCVIHNRVTGVIRRGDSNEIRNIL